MRRKRVTRDAIIEVALPLFRERGYEGTRLQDIAAALGVTQAALYDHFNYKEDILIEINERWSQGVSKTIESLNAQDVPPDAKFVRLLRGRIETAALYPNFSGVILDEVRKIRPERIDAFQNQSSRFTRLLENLYAEAVSAGRFVDVDPAVAVRTIFGAANSVSRWYRPGGHLSPKDLAEVMCGLLMKGFQRRPEPASQSSASRSEEAVKPGGTAPSLN